MPRKARIDAPGALHHNRVRGIESRSIFKDDLDRERFGAKLGTVLNGCVTLREPKPGERIPIIEFEF